VEWRLKQFEDGELLPESMKEVVSKVEAAADPWGGCAIQPDGTIKLRRGKVTSSVPARPEELRTKFKILANHWEFVRLRNPQHPIFAGYSLHMWADYVDWLLGEDVYNSTIKDARGEIVYRPSWHTLLDYDFHLRKRLFFTINNQDLTLTQALNQAKEHQPTFNKYFSTPVSLAAGAAAANAAMAGRRARSRTPTRDRPAEGTEAEQVSHLDQKGHGKGKGKGKGKNKGNGNPKGNGKGNKGGGGGGGGGGDPNGRQGASNFTPDGRAKCFRYQRGN